MGLPKQDSAPAIVGRREECARIRERLGSSDRLVTLTGPGGVGKSSLARAAVRELERTYDATWFLDLTAVADPDLLALTVARGVGMHLQSSDAPLEALVEALGERRALLVLDGCDDVLPATADLVSLLLARCPHLRVLVTGRQPLRVTGEAVLVVEPLPWPAPEDLKAAEDLLDYDAVRLFVDRAAAVVPTFRLSGDNAAAVAGICAAVQGMPLAVELAAARTVVLSPQAILERLGDQYRLLSKGARGAPERLQSLRASVAASYELCTEAERGLWARMSVFSGSFDLAAVEAVCSGDGIDELDVLDLVDSLLERSVLVREDPDPSQVRYRMLETLRAYGEEQLSVEERDRWRDRHLAWCSLLMESAAAEWFGPEQVQWCRRLRHEYPNLRAALEHAVLDPDQVSRGMRIAALGEPFWVITGRVSEARRWLGLGLTGPGAMDAGDRIRGLTVACWFATLQNDLASARSWLEELRPLVSESDPVPYAGFLRAEGWLGTWEGRLDEAEKRFREASDVSRAADDPAGQAVASFLLGLTLSFGGDAQAAADAQREVVVLTARAGEDQLRSSALGMLALDALVRGAAADAAAQAREALVAKRALGDRFGEAFLLTLRGCAAATEGPEQATVLLGAAESLWEQLAVSPRAFPGLEEARTRGLEVARETLGSRRFEDHFQRGRRLGATEAVALALGERVAAEEQSSDDSPLTARETDVAELVAQGLSNKEIAESLVISHRTAQGHVENILRKLGFSSRTQVAAWMVGRDK